MAATPKRLLPEGSERNATDTLPFQHYTLRHRIVAWISQNVMDNVTYTARHGLLKGLRRKGGLGWVPEPFAGASKKPETLFWSSLDLRGRIVYDVGGFHGLLTMFFARSASRVITYEPLSRNRKRLLENVNLNGFTNVTVRGCGAGSMKTELDLVFDPLMTGGASADSGVAGQIRSQPRAVTERITVTTLDDDIAEHDLPAPDLIKIDVEGFEIEVLRGARETLARHKPALFLEMHGETIAEKLRKAGEVLEFLNEAGYTAIRHIESGRTVAPGDAGIAMRGHLYCPRPAAGAPA